jgi:hypothetical protein
MSDEKIGEDDVEGQRLKVYGQPREDEKEEDVEGHRIRTTVQRTEGEDEEDVEGHRIAPGPKSL